MAHPKRKIELEFRVKVPIDYKDDEVGVISFCPLLDIYSQGDTEEEAKSNLQEAIMLFITSCFERGCLDEVLKGCGFEVVNEVKEVKVKKSKDLRAAPSHAADFLSLSLPLAVSHAAQKAI